MKILIINGPNLNLLGRRNREVYGDESFEQFLPKLSRDFPQCNFDYFQTNIEGEIVDRLQQADGLYAAVVLNAGGYTHTSIAITDAVEAIEVPVIEVHLSQIYAREEFRHISLIAKNSIGTIAGFGLLSYSLAITAIIDKNIK